MSSNNKEPSFCYIHLKKLRIPLLSFFFCILCFHISRSFTSDLLALCYIGVPPVQCVGIVYCSIDEQRNNLVITGAVGGVSGLPLLIIVPDSVESSVWIVQQRCPAAGSGPPFFRVLLKHQWHYLSPLCCTGKILTTYSSRNCSCVPLSAKQGVLLLQGFMKD